MKDLTITAIIKVYQYDELNEADRSLMKTAMEATARSYAPYSHFSVGAAALLNNGTIVTGTNQENAAYPSGLCAERTTLFLWRLPPSDSGNGKTLRPAYPYSAIRQRMYLRSKKYRRFTTAVI